MPSSASQNLTTTATFYQIAGANATVNFTPYISLSSTVIFLATASVSSSVTFPYYDSLEITASFSTFTDSVTATVSFPYYISLAATVDFHGLNTADLLSTVTFTESQSLSASVHFVPYASQFSTASFVQNTFDDLVSTVDFIYVSNLPATASFTVPAFTSLRATASLGNFIVNLISRVTFSTATYTDFHAAIIINPTQPFRPPLYANFNNFNSQITIYSPDTADLSVTASFRTPPIDIDVITTANFVYSYGVDAYNTETGHTYVGMVDVTGFFEIDDLPAGTYIVTPNYPNVIFNPPDMTVTITDFNPTIYFTALNISQIISYFNSQTQPICYVLPVDADPCTFSIEGYILSDNSKTAAANEVIVIITNEGLAAQYRQQFSIRTK